MSRSYRKTPIMGLAAASDKWYKRTLHKQRRRQWRELLLRGNIDDLFVEKKYDWYACNKDGKLTFFNYKKKDPSRYAEWMRK